MGKKGTSKEEDDVMRETEDPRILRGCDPTITSDRAIRFGGQKGGVG
jgi:hypothetical protein